MKIIETTVYTIDELSKDAKEKARNWWKDNDELPFLSNAMHDHLLDLVKDSAITIDADSLRVYYSLSYCQGDGAMFEATGNFSHGGVSYCFKVKHQGHYYHEKSYSVELWDENSDASDTNDNDELHTAFSSFYEGVCSALAKYGYEYIESERDDENVDRNLRESEYTFTIDGKYFS